MISIKEPFGEDENVLQKPSPSSIFETVISSEASIVNFILFVCSPSESTLTKICLLSPAGLSLNSIFAARATIGDIKSIKKA